jgi:hypothetical protein
VEAGSFIGYNQRLQRLSGRRSCPARGSNVHLMFKVPMPFSEEETSLCGILFRV